MNGVAHAEVRLLDAVRDRNRQLNDDRVLADRRIGDLLGALVARNALRAVVPFEQERNLLIVVHRPHGDRVVRGFEKALLGEELGHEIEGRRRRRFPALVVRRARHLAFDAFGLDDGVLGLHRFTGLGERGDVVGHVPTLFDGELLLVLRVGEGRHLRAGDAERDAGEDVLGIVAGAEGPGPGEVARPGALAGVALEALDGVALAFLPVALGTSVVLVKQLLAAADALGGRRNPLAVVELLGGRLFETGEGLDVDYQVPCVLFGEHVAPAGHGGARHAVADRAVEIVVAGRGPARGRGRWLFFAGGGGARGGGGGGRRSVWRRSPRPFSRRPASP